VIRIAERRAGLDDRDHAQAVELHALPCASLDVPGENRLVAGQTDFGVGKARAGVNVGAAHFDVVALDRGARLDGARGGEKTYHTCCPEFPHDLLLEKHRHDFTAGGGAIQDVCEGGRG